MMLDLVNPELVDQVQQILRRLGIVSIVRQYVNRVRQRDWSGIRSWVARHE